MTMREDLTLVSFDLCPYVQRAAIALAEKGAPFRRIDIDLTRKPAWFLALSPLGKVPLLKVGEEVLFESAAILEYIDETLPLPLHPAEPLAKARHRGWMELGASILGDLWVLETTPDQPAFAAAVEAIKGKFARIDRELGAGPFFAGDRFSMVDAVFAPVFRYFDVFDGFCALGVFDGLIRTAAWRRSLSDRPSVKAAVVHDYDKRLRAFLKERRGILASRLA